MKLQTGEYAKEQLERVVLFSVEVPGFTLIQEMTPYLLLFIYLVIVVIGRIYLSGSSGILLGILVRVTLWILILNMIKN